MKLCNFGSLDPRHQLRGVQGLKAISKADRQIWQEFEDNWTELALESEEKLQVLLGVINEQQEDFTRLDFSEKIKTETEAIRKVRIGQNFWLFGNYWSLADIYTPGHPSTLTFCSASTLSLTKSPA
jgi:putative restriction endonuclease